jgi:hypothetical protein
MEIHSRSTTAARIVLLLLSFLKAEKYLEYFHFRSRSEIARNQAYLDKLASGIGSTRAPTSEKCVQRGEADRRRGEANVEKGKKNCEADLDDATFRFIVLQPTSNSTRVCNCLHGELLWTLLKTCAVNWQKVFASSFTAEHFFCLSLPAHLSLFSSMKINYCLASLCARRAAKEIERFRQARRAPQCAL